MNNKPLTDIKNEIQGDSKERSSNRITEIANNNSTVNDDKYFSTLESTANYEKVIENNTSIVIECKEDGEYMKHITYIENGIAIYTDPETRIKYKWCSKNNKWLVWDNINSSIESNVSLSVISNQQINSDETLSNSENKHYKWCNETHQWIPKQLESTVSETEHYKWDALKNEWILKSQLATKTSSILGEEVTKINYTINEQGQRIFTDKDGVIYFWDTEKNAWFPKIDDDFMARYQMNYGFIDNTSESDEAQRIIAEEEKNRKKEFQRMTEETVEMQPAECTTKTSTLAFDVKCKSDQTQQKWFDIDPKHNTKVYVSNLPLNITIDEFAEVMGKCGMIMRDPQTQKYKLKLYTEPDGQIKGDGLCDYIKVESVDLALKILDDYNVKGNKIRVQRAKFEMRGEYNPALKPKRKKKDKEKLQKIKEKLFDWRPEKMRGERSKNERSVIIKNLFEPAIFEKEVQLILDYQNDLREECTKYGTVRKVIVYDRHPEGIAQINMSTPEEADVVIELMHGRFFGKRQLEAKHWDGKTKYKVFETETEVLQRLVKWDEYLEKDEKCQKT